MRKKVFRIIDANLNRSREGLRVCEEIARFALNSERLSRDLKTIRTRVSTLARDLDARFGALAHARDTGGDVGRSSRLPGHIGRSALRDVFMANMERAKESLRVLEEFLKLIDPAYAPRVSRQRFKAYEVEKRVLQRIDTLQHRRKGKRSRTH